MSEQRPTRRGVKFSVGLFPYERYGGVEPLVQVAQAAEDLGFYGLMLPEHIVLPSKDPPPITSLWYDNLVVASYLAARTHHVRFFLNVMVVPYRHPIVAAKQLATLDVITGGRIILGVGSGWLKPEFEALGVPFHQRGALLDEYLRAMVALWTQEPASFYGKQVRFSDVSFLPKPVQQPHIPIWVGGSGSHPMRRAAEIGDGWAPMTGTLQDLTRDRERLCQQLRARGRDPDRFEFSYLLAVGEQDPAVARATSHIGLTADTPPSTPAEAIAAINRWQDAGFTHLGITLAWDKPITLIRQMEWFASTIMPAFR